jgi:hypothetical protein
MIRLLQPPAALAALVLSFVACQRTDPGASAAPTTSAAPTATAPAPTFAPGVDLGAGPGIEIRSDAILLDGKGVGKPSDMAALGRPRKVDALFDALGALPAERRLDEVALIVDASTPWVVLDSVLRTAASAGFPVLTLAVDGSRLSLRSPALEPTGTAPDAQGQADQDSLYLSVTVSPGELGVVLKRGATVLGELAPPREGEEAQLRGFLSDVCTKRERPCFSGLLLSPEPPTRFDEIARILAMIAPHQRKPADAGKEKHPEIVLRDKKPPREAPSLPSDQAAIQSVVRAHFGEFRACYEEGLRKKNRASPGESPCASSSRRMGASVLSRNLGPAQGHPLP